jgi:RNA polymerase sigma-70 factor (ECF subfamily)
MEVYEARRTQPTAANRQRTSQVLERFLDLLGKADVTGIERMLAADVRAVADGGGEFTASRHPIVGPARVARLFVRLDTSRTTGVRIRMIDVNGFPAVLFEFDAPMGRRPPRLVLAADLNAEGLISGFWAIASTRKLTAVPLN